MRKSRALTLVPAPADPLAVARKRLSHLRLEPVAPVADMTRTRRPSRLTEAQRERCAALGLKVLGVQMGMARARSALS